jgi:ribose transport system substrate-binding protein
MEAPMIPGNRWRRLSVLAASAAAAAVLVTAGCSSSSSAGTAAAASGTASSTASAGVKQAAQALQPYLIAPAKIGVATPLKSTPAKGRTFIYIQCAFAQCKSVSTGVVAAATALGWTPKILDFDETNAATLVAAMQQALQYNPVAVSFNALPEAEWAAEIPAYQKAGVPIVPIETGPTPVTGPVIAAVGDDGGVQGQILADWFVSASGGSGKVLLVDVPAFGLLKSSADAFTQTVQQLCPGCSVTPLDATVAQQGNNQITPAVVSALQRDPSIKYVVGTDGELFPGLPTALQAGSITGLQIASGDATVENEQDVMSGTETAFVPTNFEYLGWLAVDSAARHLEGMTVAGGNDGGMPEQLFTKATTHAAAESAEIPAGFSDQFETLWHVGS